MGLNSCSVGVYEDSVDVEGGDGGTVAFGGVGIDKMKAVEGGFCPAVGGKFGADFNISA